MLRLSWKEHKTNEEVLNMMKTSLKLMKIIKKRKCEYFRHFIRRPNSIQILLLEARIDGKRKGKTKNNVDGQYQGLVKLKLK